MFKNLPYTQIALIFLIPLLLLAATSCNQEEETYDIQTDEEFLEAADKAVERLLRENNKEVVYENLYKAFSNRYSETEIKEYVKIRADEEKEIFSSRANILEQQIEELEKRIDDYWEQLENQDEEAGMEKVEEKIVPLYDWIDKFASEMEETADHYRIIELVEEKKNTLEKVANILEEQLQSENPGFNRDSLQKRDLLNYYYKIEYLLEKGSRISAGYAQVTGENHISDQVLYDELNKKLIPESETLLEELKRVEVENDEIKKLHDNYNQGWKLQLEGFKLLSKALNEKDDDIIKQADELIEEGAFLRKNYLEKLNHKIYE